MRTLDFEKPIIELERKIEELIKFSEKEKIDVSFEINNLEKKLLDLKKEIYGNLTAWQRIQIARHPDRPYMMDYVKGIFENFIELHGDRKFFDDKAMVCGIGELGGVNVAIVGQHKGRDTKEKLERNFGCAHPEGYRKALRIMKLADKFGLPIISFVDTPGAYPGIGAEERGQAEAIAVNIREMFSLKVPIIVVIIGEGGSGGALGIGVGDSVLILENAYYSVISPEGCAAILWKDRAKADLAANALKLTPKDLIELGIVDEIIPEPLGGAHKNVKESVENVKIAIDKHLKRLVQLDADQLIRDRYAKFRKMGVFGEGQQEDATVDESAEKSIASDVDKGGNAEEVENQPVSYEKDDKE